MSDYIHTVQYYETDKMGITHHSNYIRWMEEARIAFMESIGLSYARMEEDGLFSPVTAVDCKYLTPTTFPDAVSIHVTVEEFKGVKLRLKYTMLNDSKKTVCEGHSEHCFLDRNNKIVALKKTNPALYNKFAELVESDSQ